MANMTVLLGAGLAALGIVSYIGSGADSVTALIPTFFGVMFVALGKAAQREARRVMHAALGLAVVGLRLLGTIPGLFDLGDLLAGRDLDRPWAVGAQSAMAIALAVYLAFGVRSFVAARRTSTA
jgi:hypothetical protein